MGDDGRLAPRQIWAQPTTTSTKTYLPGCTPFLLPSDGMLHYNKLESCSISAFLLLVDTEKLSLRVSYRADPKFIRFRSPLGFVYLNRTFAITLSENAIFDPMCTTTPTATRNPSPVLDTRDPFYASVTPQLYAIGCATVVSYLLVIILLITPRTFYVGGPGGGANFLGRHGMITGSYSGNSSVVGVGGRPWLQKVAAILVAISLTIATADSFEVAERQYDYGYSDAEALASEVIDGMEIRIVRVISSTFLWLAQVQTLIRLFPRHKEKIMIKWAGFALIVLDTIFSILDKFLVQSNTTRPRLYEDAIPALSYLFELALNLLYAAWVIFYSISKHRFAFFHPKMRNICLVALLSLCAVLIPVVFFVLDIAKPEIAGWGTYIRWVGSAAASVVVWEWVERIEALERDERKDGILGREVFDGDEMLEVTPSEEVDWPRHHLPGNDRGGATGMSSGWGGMMGLGSRPLRTRVTRNWQPNPNNQNALASANSRRRRPAPRPTPPPAAVTPVSRADTTSAASTVYNVHYHPVSSPTPPVTMPYMEEEDENGYDPDGDKEIVALEGQPAPDQFPADPNREHSPQIINTDQRWRTILNPFRRRHASLPKEVASAQAEEEGFLVHGEDVAPDETEKRQDASRLRPDLFSFNWKGRTGAGRLDPAASLPVTVIPARRRGQNTWSPQWFNDSNLPERSSSQRGTANHTDPRTRVIQPQVQTAAPWTAADVEGDFPAANYELRYDPEAAALVPDDQVDREFTHTGGEYSVNTAPSATADGAEGHASQGQQPDEEDHQPLQSSNDPHGNRRSGEDSRSRR